MEKIRKHFIFKGRVQGVGFRYRSMYAARSLGITGWVQNLPDGSVEMEAQGSGDMINKMLTMLNRDTYIKIDWMDSENILLQEKEHGFRVKGY